MLQNILLPDYEIYISCSLTMICAVTKIHLMITCTGTDCKSAPAEGQQLSVCKLYRHRFGNLRQRGPAEGQQLLVCKLYRHRFGNLRQRGGILQRFKEVETLPEHEQSVLLEVIAAYIRDFRTKQAYVF